MKLTKLFFLICMFASFLSACGAEGIEFGAGVEEPTNLLDEIKELEETKIYMEVIPDHEINVDISVADENLQKLKENEPDISGLRDAIRNSVTNIEKAEEFIQGRTYTGTAYYVSNSGDDNNDGVSPESAWATLDKVNDSSFNRGDAIFFERGSVWYGRVCINADEMTFSAYGEGAKPIISGSDPSVLLPESWQEYGKTEDGGTVWVFEGAQTDVSHIIYDNESKTAIRYTPAIKDGIYINEMREPFDPTKELKENLSFFSESDLSEWDIQQTLADEYHPSKLFLRCDEGNPADVLPDMHLIYSLVGFANEYCGTVVDNIDIQSFGSLAVSGGMAWCTKIKEEYPLTPTILVQNCEISFCGGNISNYNPAEEDIWRPNTSGGAMQLSGNGNRALNNYIHDVDSKVFVVAHHGNYEVQGLGYKGIEIRGNLLTNNGCALHVTDYGYSMTGNEQACYFDVEFTDNSVLYTGYGWFREHNRNKDYMYNHDMCAMDICGIAYEKDNIIVQNNLFYGAELMLIANTSDRGHPDETGPLELKNVQFSGNTFAQYGNFGRIAADAYTGTDLEIFVKTILEDETGTVSVE